jgi:WD40 repeat protein
MTEETIFLTALDKQDAAERSAYLREACGDDAALRQRVEALLKSHEEAGHFLERPALAPVGETQTAPGDGGGEDFGLDFLAPSDRPGALGRLGHYDVLEMVGRGGFGVVLKAFDNVLQRVVAVKVMAPQLAVTASARKRFIREAQAAAAVRDEHVIDIHAVDEANGLPYLVMEYVNGISLQERLDRDGPLELKEVLRIGMQTASGLAKAHAQGLVHRDVKPANILLENGVQRVKITDFGLARAVDDASLTQSGLIAGTPQYMAPEQARGEPVDHRADLFSLGSVLYAMCTGRAPFRGSTTMAVLKRVSEDEPRPVREVNPEVPDWLAALIARLHAKSPADRYQSAAEVAEELSRQLVRLQRPGAPVPVPVPAPVPVFAPARPIGNGKGNGHGHGARRWAAAAAGLLLLAGGLGVSEATGVTKLTATVIRIFSPDGTLVVEVDDPGVRVSIDGEDIRILGAGPHEVRVRPGVAHRFQAVKDGQTVRQELVTVERGGKRVVRVSREAAGAQAAAADLRPRAAIEGAALSSAAFSADGRFLALGSSNTVQVWDQAAQKQLFILRGHRAWVWTVAFSPDSKTLASASMDHTVKLWDLSNGQCRATLEGHTDKVWDVAFSPDGKTLVSASEDNSVRLWDVATGKPQKVLGTHDSHAFAALFTADGRAVVSGDVTGDVRLWDVGSGKVLARFDGHAAVVRLALTADGKALATASHDRTVKLWDLGTRRLLRTLRGHTLPIERVAFSPDGRLLATVSGDFQQQKVPGEVKLWDVASGQELLSLKGHRGPVHGVAFAPDGRTLATGSADGSAKLWDVSRWASAAATPDKPAAGAAPRATLEGHTSWVWGVAFAPDGRALASASRDGTVKLWRRHGPDWREEVTLEGNAGALRCVAFAPGGKTLAAAGEGRAVRLWQWDGKAWSPGPTLTGHKGPIYALAFSPDGKKLASAGGVWPEVKPGEVKVWEASTGQPLASLEGHDKNVNGVAFAPDGGTVATASADYTVRLWDATTGKHLATLYAADGCNGVSFSPDGKALAAGSGDRSVRLWKWDGTGWRRDKILRTHGGPVWGVAFSRDGNTLATASHDKTVKLYDVRTGEELATLRGHAQEVVSVAFSADGLLATGSWDGTVKLWDVAGLTPGAGRAERPAASFVVLARGGQPERPYDSLAEAVAGARAGDTVEVRGDGPFVSPPVFVRKALTIRAGEGARPVLELGPAYVRGTLPLLEATAPLVLEGLHLRRVGKERYQSGRLPRIIFAQRAPLRAANCRFVGYPDCAAILTEWSPACELRNCEFLGDGRFARIDHYLPHGGRLVLANNVMLGGEFGAAFHYAQPDLADMAVELTGNTVVAQTPLALFLDKLPAPRAPAAEAPTRPIRLKAAGNVLDGELQVLEFFQPAELASAAGPQRAKEAQARLGQLVAWSEQNNVYPQSVSLLGLYGKPPEPLPAGKGLADWDRFWGVKDTASVPGEIRYRGGDLRSRAVTQLEQVAAEDFRLQAGSPGHGAAKGGLDLGADVDLVGPGPAYERWKKAPEYRQWLKDTGAGRVSR